MSFLDHFFSNGFAMNFLKKSILFKIIFVVAVGWSFVVCAALYAPNFDNWKVANFFVDRSLQIFPKLRGKGKVSEMGRFYYTSGIAVDTLGTVYVADVGNHTIRKISKTGVVSTLAGSPGVSGNADGIGRAAQFQVLAGIAVDLSGNLYVADQGNSTIRKIFPNGRVITLAGLADVRGSVDGDGENARFNYPTGVAVDSLGNIYVADMGNEVIRKITPKGVVSTFAGLKLTPGIYLHGHDLFKGPKAVAVDSSDNVYVAEAGNHIIRKITQNGLVTRISGDPEHTGSSDEYFNSAARFNSPAGITVDSFGKIYVADTGNHTIRKILVANNVGTLAGSPGIEGTVDAKGKNARFRFPVGIAVDSSGNLFVADSSNSTVRKINIATAEVTTFAGTAGKRGLSDSQ
jgi:sugar lactone lactonase YvrE